MSHALADTPLRPRRLAPSISQSYLDKVSRARGPPHLQLRCALGSSAMATANEALLRLTVFACVLAALALWELAAPRRSQRLGRGLRWTGNLGVVVLDTLLVRVLFPVTAIGLALVSEARGWGLLQVLALPAWASIPLAFVALCVA